MIRDQLINVELSEEIVGRLARIGFSMNQSNFNPGYMPLSQVILELVVEEENRRGLIAEPVPVTGEAL